MNIDNTVKRIDLNEDFSIITENITHSNRAFIKIFTNGGSCSETVENNGIAHFLEHMLFKGTKNKNYEEILEKFTSLGVIFNACTGNDYVCYIADIAPVSDNSISETLDLLFELILESTFPEGEIEKEKTVVVQELKNSFDSLEDKVLDNFLNISYGDSYLGRTILGPEKNIRNFTKKDLEHYLYNCYNRFAVVAVGKINRDIIIEKSQVFYENVKKKFLLSKEKKEILVYNLNTENKIITLDWANQSHVIMGWQSPKPESHESKILDLASFLLGESCNSILFKEVREKMGLVYSIYSNQLEFRDHCSFMVYFGTYRSKVNQVIDVVHESIKKLYDTNEEKLEEAKRFIIGSRIRSTENLNKRTNFYGINFINKRQEKTIDEYIFEVQNITLNEVFDIIRKFLDKKADKITQILGKEEKEETH